MKKIAVLLLVSAIAIAGVFANGQSQASGGVNKEITVMVPPWAEPSAELLKEFEEKTGISVIMNIVGWDDIRNKVAIAAVGEIAPADVIEVDWSWTGEFGSADWLEPIELTAREKADTLVLGSFTYDKKILALPYANDFRLGYYNTNDFAQAGYDVAPDNWDEMLEACLAIKAGGIKKYPMSFTLSATEAATTSLLWMTISKYGNFFNDDFTVNRSNVLSALKFVKQLVLEYKLIDPASQNMKDIEVYEKLLTDDTSFMVGPTYFIGLINKEGTSQVKGNAKPTLVPGSGSIKSASFALPEGIGISKFSKDKESALEFVKWYTSPETQMKLYKFNGNIPCHVSALESLINEGLIQDGQVLLKQAEYVASPFPGGIPNWYAEMSNTIYNNVNKMIQGVVSPEQAFETIDTKVKELGNK